ncbi:MAG TPA: hypothetical protein PKC98_12990 [Candidatus Melainabacteria bacterium]|nr:hypothetical protein [Candidatus Melainabacteria bacterium]
MSSPKEEEAKRKVAKMTENFLKGVPEEARLPSNEPDPLEGTSHEVAFIDDDGALFIRVSGQKDFVMGQGWDSIPPGDPKYAEYCAKYGLEKPGDSKTIFRRFIDGQWIEVEEE